MAIMRRIPSPACTLQILEGILPKEVQRGGPPPDKKLLEHHFVFACIWAFGGCLLVDKITDYRLQFSRWWQGEHKTVLFPAEVSGAAMFLRADFLPASSKASATWCTLGIICDRAPVGCLQGTVFDYFVDDQNVCMTHWRQRVTQFTYVPGLRMPRGMLS